MEWNITESERMFQIVNFKTNVSYKETTNYYSGVPIIDKEIVTIIGHNLILWMKFAYSSTGYKWRLKMRAFKRNVTTIQGKPKTLFKYDQACTPFESSIWIISKNYFFPLTPSLFVKSWSINGG